MITLLSIFRNPTLFKAAVAMVPVTNLFQRLAWKGVERQHQAIDPAQPLRRPAVRAPRHLQGSVAALQRRQAADSAVRRRDEERRGREHRRGHAAGGRAARRASRRSRRRWCTTTRRAAIRSIAASIRRRGSRRTRASSAIRGTASGRFSTGTWIRSTRPRRAPSASNIAFGSATKTRKHETY